MKNKNTHNGTLTALKKLKHSSTIDQYVSNISSDGNIIEVDTKQITKWKFKDRPNDELGDIADLARTFKLVGQQQPCIVRYLENDKNKYELIVGERRWRAASFLGTKLKIIVSNIDDKTAAIIQAIENEKRSDLSDYAKGMSYSNKIENNILTQKDLTDILGISKQQVTRLLSFRKIPTSIKSAIKDFRKVSARTSYEISRLSQKGDQYVEIILFLAHKISKGQIGATKLIKEVEKKLPTTNHNKDIDDIYKINNKSNNHLCTLIFDQDNRATLKFSNLINKKLRDINNVKNIIQKLEILLEKLN